MYRAVHGPCSPRARAAAGAPLRVNDAARWELQQRLDPLLRPRHETGKHADIWARVCELLDQRAAGEVAGTWVKGHATQEYVDWGITTPEQLFRNERADELATAALDVHLTDALKAAVG